MQREVNKETSVMTESWDISIAMGLEREPAKTGSCRQRGRVKIPKVWYLQGQEMKES